MEPQQTEKRKAQCPLCAAEGHDRSESNMTIYPDGGKYCHKKHGVIERSDGGVPDHPPDESKFLSTGGYEDITSRRLSADICKKYRYQIVRGEEYTNPQGKTREINGHIAHYYKNGKVVAQKIREGGKVLWSIGNPNSGELFGQHTCRGQGGKWLCITEGELDCLSIAQVHTHYDVVSLPGGVSTAREAIQKNLEFVNGYEEVILAFDSDEAGQDAVDAVKEGLIRPGKLKIASLRYKDASEYLQKGKTKELMDDLWGAAKYSPPGIISSSELDWRQTRPEILPYPDMALNKAMLGREVGTITALVAGTGVGKTTNVMRILENDLTLGYGVGAIMLEATPTQVCLDIAGLRLGKPIRRILRQRDIMALDSRIDDPLIEDDLTDDEIEMEFAKVRTQKLELWNPETPPHYDSILDRMEFMSLGLGCKALYLDHMSLMSFGSKSEVEGLDDFANKLKALSSRIPSHIFVVSQLSQSQGSPVFEEGGVPRERDIRGSQRVVSVFAETLAMTRNKAADNEEERNTTKYTCVKARLGGETGYITSYRYDKQSGRLNPTQRADAMAMLDTPTPTPQQEFNIEEFE